MGEVAKLVSHISSSDDPIEDRVVRNSVQNDSFLGRGADRGLCEGERESLCARVRKRGRRGRSVVMGGRKGNRRGIARRILIEIESMQSSCRERHALRSYHRRGMRGVLCELIGGD